MEDKAEGIARLNDAFREALGGGRNVYATAGINSLPVEDQLHIFGLVRTFNDFSEDNDPYGEHDFGAFDHKGERVFWKIDYFAPDMQHGSEDPADPEKTVRVMTVMLAREY